MSISNTDFPIPQQPAKTPDPTPTSKPQATDQKPATNEQAVNLIRQKLDLVYGVEPPAEAEEKEIEAVGAQSKHQQYMQAMMDSGKSMSEIQAAWHAYYTSLPKNEKLEVWQEFYANNTPHTTNTLHSSRPRTHKQVVNPPKHTPYTKKTATVGVFQDEITDSKKANPKTASDIKVTKKAILDKVSAGGKLNAKHHLQSLFFGLGVGSIVIFIFMFGFFNERFIAPFIQPSRLASSSPIIVDPTTNNKVGPENKVVIPKINVDVPVVYDVPGISEKDMQSALERGVVHYPQSPVPGQNGNVVVVGHSSNNIFNNGKYKFAFVLLNRLQEGDIFMLNYAGQRYTYKIYSKKIVKPTDVAVMGPADKLATATLITCDPPGTAINRLIILGEQISPATNNNSIATNTDTSPTQTETTIPGNSESLFQRLFGWIF